LEELIATKPAEIIVLQKPRTNFAALAKLDEKVISLQDLDTMEVFEKCIEQTSDVSKEEMSELKGSFQELLTWMQENESE
jgi:hypothetical protein